MNERSLYVRSVYDSSYIIRKTRRIVPTKRLSSPRFFVTSQSDRLRTVYLYILIRLVPITSAAFQPNNIYLTLSSSFNLHALHDISVSALTIIFNLPLP